MKSVCGHLIGRDLDWPFHALAHVANKQIAVNPTPLSDAMREHEFCVGINARPKPEVTAPFFFLHHPARVTADILPLLVHLDSQARQIAQFFVHVIGERFASLANHAEHRRFVGAVDSADRVDWSPCAERREH